MPTKQWEPLLVWKFRGRRFEEDDGLDLRDLDELVRLRAILVELAKDVWRRENPERIRISPNAEQSIELRFFRTEKGSCAVPIFYSAPVAEQVDMFGGDVDERALASKLPAAAHVLASALRSFALQGRFPSTLPSDIVGKLGDIGKALRNADESIELDVTEGRRIMRVGPSHPVEESTATTRATDEGPVVLDAALRAKLEHATIEPARSRRTLAGEVTMASIKGRAMIRPDDGGAEVELVFAAEREEEITRALHERHRLRLRVRGEAEIEPRGRIRRLIVEDLRVLEHAEEVPVELRLREQAAQSPDVFLEALRAGSMPTTELTFAAEIAGDAFPADVIVPVLLPLLQHGSPLVREGALYGLARHEDYAGVLDAIRAVAEKDVSPGVRAVAEAILEER